MYILKQPFLIGRVYLEIIKKSVKYVSQRIESPVSYGWYSPKILIPPTIGLKQFEMVAVHKLAHVH